MNKTLRLTALLLVLFGLATIAVDRRARRMRQGFRVRELLDRQARVKNEIRYLHGEVLILEDRAALEDRARRLGVPLGTLKGRKVKAPAPVEGPEKQ